MLLTIPFHSLSFQDVDGNPVNMSSFASKKVLLVNIATESSRINQMSELQQLQQQYNDSLVVIVFPSNSFGKENKTNAEIKQFLNTNYHFTGIIAAKSNVINAGINPVFSWLASISQNGDVSASAGGDFQKFLISKDGSVIGVFSTKIAASDSSIIEAINTSY